MSSDWPGSINARDLGGLPVRGGGATRPGALLRSGALDGLTAAGWAALVEHGVRTLIDLRNDDERPRDTPRPATTVHLALDGTDEAFWAPWRAGPQFGTPLYYAPHIERFPELSAAVLRAIIAAQPGGVLVHCAGGRDRSGMITMLALAAVGVEPDAIADDYGRSVGPDTAAIEAFLASRGTSPRAALLDALATVDPTALIEAHEVVALRARLVQ